MQCNSICEDTLLLCNYRVYSGHANFISPERTKLLGVSLPVTGGFFLYAGRYVYPDLQNLRIVIDDLIDGLLRGTFNFISLDFFLFPLNKLRCFHNEFFI